jgi:osmotically-inducible protein OsmY/sporulation protein YlmC with PRC-barrel domain
MQNERKRIAGALVIISLALATTGIGAEEQERYGQPRFGRERQQTQTSDQNKSSGQSAQLKASQLIGKDVRNAQDENLGRVQDLIVDLSSGSVPYAIIGYGGALGIGNTKIAVPIDALECSSDGKNLLMSATKDEFQSASKTPTGAWSQASGEWTRDVDAFYGQPSAFTQGRFERQPLQGVQQREFVRDPTQHKGATDLLTKPGTTDLNHKISAAIDEVRPGISGDIQVSADNGVVTLRGEVSSNEEKQSIESKVMGVPGVQRVDNQLMVKNQ